MSQTSNVKRQTSHNTQHATRNTQHASRWAEFIIEAAIRLLGFSSIGFVTLIFLFLLREGMPVFLQVPLSNLFSTRWYPTFDLFGTMPLILGSTLVTVTAIAIALPLGTATAVFVREVAPGWVREVLKPMIEVLAGIPSVVLGFFGMTLVAPLVREILDAPTGLTAFAGALLLAYMSLPTLISVAEDALDAVPKSYRDAGLAMGATRWQTIRRVLVPAAKPGLLVAIILGMGRAIGETMAVALVIGPSNAFPTSLWSPTHTLTTKIMIGMGESTGVQRSALFAMGLVLLLLSMALILLVRVVSGKREMAG